MLPCGIVLTWSSPMVIKLQNEEIETNPFGRVVTDDEVSWMTSLMSLGAVFGPYPFGYVSQKFGRKISLLTVATTFTTSFLILAFANIIPLYYVARILSGVALSGGYAIVPLYMAEITEPRNRGFIGAFTFLTVPLGILYSYTIGPIASVLLFNLIGAVICIISILLVILFIPETPYYQVSVNKTEAAIEVLTKLRGTKIKFFDDEVQSIEDDIQQSSAGRIADLFESKGTIKALMICLVLIALQPLSGASNVIFYTQTIFEAAGTTISSHTCSIIMGCVQLGCVLFTPAIVEKGGRKISLIVFSSLMFVSEFTLALFFYLENETDTNTKNIFWLPIACLVVFIVGYSCGLGGTPWIIMGETFPVKVKSLASPLVVSSNWVINFAVSQAFVPLNKTIGMAATFWLFSSLCLIVPLFTYFVVPETKGKSFQEIQKKLNS